MKNISRRVFIKGMAVAAAATAASTVLAGCNIVPGKDEPVEVPGFKPETKTLTSGDDTFTITATKLGVAANGYFAVGMTMVNDLASDITVATSKNKNYLCVTACYDNMPASKPATLDTSFYTGNNFLTDKKSVKHNTDAITYTNESNLYVTTVGAPKDWKSVTLTFVLCDANGKAVDEVSFTFNK